MKTWPVVLALSLFIGVAYAQDDRSVKSPNGRVEFRLFTALPDDSILNCLAYQVWLLGKPLIETSYLGLDILFQEPLLGENVGLSAAKRTYETRYNGLRADYLQTSTTGRRIQFEVRVWNDRVAFRYIVPKSALLFDLAISDDATQFRFPAGGSEKLPEQALLPYIREVPGVAWVGIFSKEMSDFPKMQLKRLDAQTMVTHLPGGVPEQQPAFKTETPWTGPWHIILIGADHKKLVQSEVLADRLLP
jgi:Glycosyl-hydrolase 97 N-terminal